MSGERRRRDGVESTAGQLRQSAKSRRVSLFSVAYFSVAYISAAYFSADALTSGLIRWSSFNRFVMMQLNERRGQFIAAREIDRNHPPDARVVRSLASLFHPVLYAGVGQLLRITQQKLAWLVGRCRASASIRR